MVYIMRRLFFLSALMLTLVLLCSCSQRRTVDVKPGPAQILFEDSVIDLGQQQAGARKLHRDVLFYNTGSEPLVIHDLQSSCHCTVVTTTREPVMPGKSGEIRLEFDLSGISGRFQRTFTVYDNTAEGRHTVLIQGEAVSHEDDQ